MSAVPDWFAAARAADMKSLPGGSFRNTSLLECDLTAYVKNPVRLDELADFEPTEDYVDGKVRLDCNGEVADIASIGAFVTWRSAPGTALVEFVCPRCDRLHASMSIAKPASGMERP